MNQNLIKWLAFLTTESGNGEFKGKVEYKISTPKFFMIIKFRNNQVGCKILLTNQISQ